MPCQQFSGNDGVEAEAGLFGLASAFGDARCCLREPVNLTVLLYFVPEDVHTYPLKGCESLKIQSSCMICHYPHHQRTLRGD